MNGVIIYFLKGIIACLLKPYNQWLIIQYLND
jgi:hypothetical protein